MNPTQPFHPAPDNTQKPLDPDTLISSTPITHTPDSQHPLSVLPKTTRTLLAGIEQGLHHAAQIYVSLNALTIANFALGHAFHTLAHTSNHTPISPSQSTLTPDQSPLTPDQHTLWMSACKPLAAVLALQAVAQGLLHLDEPVANKIPEFASHGKQDITLEHLLTHTAGFRGPLNNFSPGSFDDIVARACNLKLEPLWTPGQRAGYHVASSWFILAALLEITTGQSFPQLVQANIASPLNQSIRFHITDPADFARVPLMHITDPNAIPKSGSPTDWPGNDPTLARIPRPGASARGPIQALGRFYESLLFDNHLLDAEHRKLLSSRRRSGLFDQTFKEPLDWGLGVMVDSKYTDTNAQQREHAYGFGPHASPHTFGHGGNQSSIAFADPAHGLVVAWTCLGMPGEQAHQLRNRAINQAIYQDLQLNT